MNYRRWAVVLAVSAVGCKSNPTPSPAKPGRPARPLVEGSAPRATALDSCLPDNAPPFTAVTPIQRGAGYVRRTYVSGEESVEITISSFGQEPGAYDRWVSGSANYPQASLSLPPEQANGFFSCASELAESPCDLHIQLRSGFHVEVMGNGHVPRGDLMQLMSHVKLADLPDSPLAAL